MFLRIAQLFEQALVLHDVGLVRDDDLRAGGKVGGILRELCVDGVKVLDRVAASLPDTSTT